ncbi:FecR family protein [Maribellus maritimus]|uniref:FecR family protein n=1 Tax=Maribellus maritimus TaxID=2870838 RepID=UPI001EEC3042|nr:FecR family protein [Maribellus maritimus]MCG6187245.1 FecR family protein [Maribellus maritimus]
MEFEKDNNISIINKYLAGESSPEELQNAFKLFESPYKNLNLRKIIFEWWNNEKELESQPKPDNLSEILDKIHHQINLGQVQPQKKSKKIIIKYSRIAAILVLGFLAGFFVHLMKKEQPVYYTSIAPIGSVSQVILPDSSMVYLNSGSKITYTTSGADRNRVVFLDGEGWFDVTKNSKKPFVVITPSYKIKVIGTKFNVKGYKTESKVTTTLEEGKIQIIPSSNPNFKTTTVLEPGEQFIFDSEQNIFETKHVNTKLFSSWRDNKLIFINMNLKELIILLERKFGVDIVVADNIVLDYHYDGTIKNETILEVLELLQETLPINYRIEGQQVIIQKR